MENWPCPSKEYFSESIVSFFEISFSFQATQSKMAQLPSFGTVFAQDFVSPEEGTQVMHHRQIAYGM